MQSTKPAGRGGPAPKDRVYTGPPWAPKEPLPSGNGFAKKYPLDDVLARANASSIRETGRPLSDAALDRIATTHEIVAGKLCQITAKA